MFPSWFRKTTPAEPLPVAMSAIKLGDRLLVIGCSDPVLIAQLAVKTGLTGRSCALDEQSDVVAAAARTVEREGALLETFTAPVTMLPLDSGAFDVVVIRGVLGRLDAMRRSACVAEALRVLRPGGRCVDISSAPRGGLASLVQTRADSPDYVASGGAEAALRAAGFRAVRRLVARGRLQFTEGIKQT